MLSAFPFLLHGRVRVGARGLLVPLDVKRTLLHSPWLLVPSTERERACTREREQVRARARERERERESERASERERVGAWARESCVMCACTQGCIHERHTHTSTHTGHTYTSNRTQPAQPRTHLPSLPSPPLLNSHLIASDRVTHQQDVPIGQTASGLLCREPPHPAAGTAALPLRPQAVGPIQRCLPHSPPHLCSPVRGAIRRRWRRRRRRWWWWRRRMRGGRNGRRSMGKV